MYIYNYIYNGYLYIYIHCVHIYIYNIIICSMFIHSIGGLCAINIKHWGYQMMGAMRITPVDFGVPYVYSFGANRTGIQPRATLSYTG